MVGSRAGLALALAAAAMAAAWIAAGPFGPDRAALDRPIPPLPQGSEPLSIVAFGTSLTARYDWPDALAGALRRCLSRPVEVTRVAMPGAGSGWALANVGRVRATAPDLVLVEFSINDADLLDGVSLAESRANHERLLSLLAGRPEMRVALLTMSPAIGLRGLIRWRLDAYYALYGPLAERHGAGLVDLRMRWGEVDDLARALPDGVHPLDEVATAVIVPPLLAAIGQAAGARCGEAAPSPPG